MRILHVKGGRPLGGIGTFIKNMVLNLSNIKSDFLFNISDIEYEHFDEEIISKGCNVYLAPKLNHILKYIRYVRNFYKLNARKYDIVHIHSPNIAIFHLYYAKKYNIEHRILHSHNTVYSDNPIKSLRNYFLQLLNKYYYTDCIACGELSGHHLFKNNNFTVINNSIDLDKYYFCSDLRSKMRINTGNDKLVIGHIGNFLKQKNHLFMIKLAKKLKSNNCNFKMIFLGDGILFDKIKRKVIDENLQDHIELVGSVTNVNEYINMFDLCILPSHFEGFPYVAIEAQRVGIPLILSNSIDKTVKLNNNVYFLPNKIDLWIKAIYNVEIGSHEELNDINFEMFSSSTQVKLLEEFYANVIRRINR